jgi:hypothetical protein
MGRKKKSVREAVGDIVEIPLGEGRYAYARILEEGVFAIYDSIEKSKLPAEQVISKVVLFRIPVMAHAVKSGRWPIVGRAPLEPSMQPITEFFMQDTLNPAKIEIYRHGETRPATRDEVRGLERAAVWDPSHVEDRIRDHFAGRPNKWFDSLRLK